MLLFAKPVVPVILLSVFSIFSIEIAVEISCLLTFTYLLRFCCNKRPDRQIVSTGSQVLIVFKSESADAPTSARRGFNISYQAGRLTGIEGLFISYVKFEVGESKKVRQGKG